MEEKTTAANKTSSVITIDRAQMQRILQNAISMQATTPSISLRKVLPFGKRVKIIEF